MRERKSGKAKIKKAECGLLDSKYHYQIEDKEAAVNHQVSRYLSLARLRVGVLGLRMGMGMPLTGGI